MRVVQSLAFAILALGGFAAGVTLPQTSFAQSADDDDDDDDDNDNSPAIGDDDADAPDPDDPASSVDDEPGPAGMSGMGAEAADNDDDAMASGPGMAAGDNDDDDAPSGPGAGVSAGASDDDDDDDAPPGMAPAIGSGDDDDDDGPTASSAASSPGSADNDDDDDGPSTSGASIAGAGAAGGASGPGDDDRDDDRSESAGSRPVAEVAGSDSNTVSRSESLTGSDPTVEITGGGGESEAQRVAQDRKDGIETDRDGFRYRRNEFVAINLDARDIAALRRRGFAVLQSHRLLSSRSTVYLVKGPARLADTEALTLLDNIADPDSLSLNHLFDSSSGELIRQRARSALPRVACGCQIGMIDTAVAARLPAFRHVTVEQQAFNGRLPVPRSHGTAVAHQFAGTSARRGRPTRIHVADIFSGQRATSGSTYALVRALDWLAMRRVAVINVSLAGPRNPVVAGTVERLSQLGHVIVAAAGNDGPAAPPVFPGAYAGVVAVTAVDARQQVYRYANRGTYVDFSALGVRVPAIGPRGEITAATGTSFAAPAVAARLARELARPDPAASARLLARLAREARDLGTPGRDSVFGHGLIGDAP